MSDLTPSQLEELKQLLLSRKDELLLNINEGAVTTLQVESDQLIEEMDQASTSASQAVRLRVMDKEAKLLREIEHALDKFDQGEYGICEGNGEPIGYRRLKIVPWTRYSIAYKEEREHQQRQISGKRAGR